MTELPKKLRGRVKERANQYCDRHGFARPYTDQILYDIHVDAGTAIATELYADLAMAMEALEDCEQTFRNLGAGKSAHNLAGKYVQKLRAKYNDQETEGGE